LSIFFFSSRRRHTRSKRDWSSDVCSSDLGAASIAIATHSSRPYGPASRPSPVVTPLRSVELRVFGAAALELEEVRVAGQHRRAVEDRSEEHTSELQSRFDLVCRLLLEKKKNIK